MEDIIISTRAYLNSCHIAAAFCDSANLACAQASNTYLRCQKCWGLQHAGLQVRRLCSTLQQPLPVVPHLAALLCHPQTAARGAAPRKPLTPSPLPWPPAKTR